MSYQAERASVFLRDVRSMTPAPMVAGRGWLLVRERGRRERRGKREEEETKQEEENGEGVALLCLVVDVCCHLRGWSFTS